MQAVYWLFTNPVSKFWLQDEKLGGYGVRRRLGGRARRCANIGQGTARDTSAQKQRCVKVHLPHFGLPLRHDYRVMPRFKTYQISNQ